MASNQPLVSIVVPVYNSEHYLSAALESVLAQTYRPVEIIAIDDGSTDNSSGILSTFSRHIQIIRQANTGQGIARNRACAASKGSIIAFIDADDLWDQAKLEKQVAILDHFPGAVATYCDCRTIDEMGAVTSTTTALGTPRPSGNVLQQLLIGNCVISPSLALVRRDAFIQAGGFNESQSRASEDYGLWLTLATLGPFIYSPETLASYRRYKSQTTQDPLFNYNKALGDLCSFDRIAPYMEQNTNKNTRLIYLQRLWEVLMTLAWSARCNGDRSVAINSYLRGLRMRPWRLDILAQLLRCL